MAETVTGRKVLVDPRKILEGGPGKDGIPSIDRPRFDTAAQAGRWLEERDPLLTVESGDKVKAYPLRIMSWHEIVNDWVGGVPVAVTYCPLCGSAVTFRRVLDGQEVELGVSGKLYNSDLVMYDRKTDTLWSQILGLAILGELAGQRLDVLKTDLVDFRALRQHHPAAQVLSPDTGFARDYGMNPYGDYDQSPRIFFPVEHASDELFAKERVVGVELEGAYKAYRLETLRQRREIRDSLAGQEVILRVNDDGTISARAAEGRELVFVHAFWFAWFAFHPDTGVLK